MQIDCFARVYLNEHKNFHYLRSYWKFPFYLSGGPIDHPNSMGMVNEFGGMTPDSNFINQSPANQGGGGGVNGPGNVNSEHIINSQRGSSPSEFMNSGNFSEPQNMQNEGLVW